MENLNTERTNSNTNKQLSSVYSYEELREYIMRINKAATYRGNCDCENVPIILREFIKGYEDKIFELENRLKECENGYEGTLHLESCKLHDAEEKVKELTDNLHATRTELTRVQEENKAWQKQLISTKEQADKAYYELACDVEDLQAENERMNVVNERLRIDYETLENENERMRAEIEDLKSELEKRPPKLVITKI